MAKAVAILAAITLLCFAGVRAGDPDIISDFSVPDGVDETKLDGTFFTYTGLHSGAPPPPPTMLPARKLFPSGASQPSTGMGVSLELLEFPAGAVNVPHTHPQGAELLFVVDGALTVGSTDTSGKLYKDVLQKGDVFVFPKGLPHYEANTFHMKNQEMATKRKSGLQKERLYLI